MQNAYNWDILHHNSTLYFDSHALCVADTDKKNPQKHAGLHSAKSASMQKHILRCKPKYQFWNVLTYWLFCHSNIVAQFLVLTAEFMLRQRSYLWSLHVLPVIAYVFSSFSFKRMRDEGLITCFSWSSSQAMDSVCRHPVSAWDVLMQ